MSFDHHLNLIAYGQLAPESVEAVAARLAELDSRLPAPIRDELTRLLNGQRPSDVALQMRAALSPGHQRQEARRINELAPEAEPTPAQIAEAAEYLLLEATNPLAASPDARTKLVALDRVY
jgi:type I restriction enzyme R subunit